MQSNKPARFFLILLGLLLFTTGCAQYPMGLSKEQWEALSPAQQAEYQSKQYAINAERQREWEARRQEQARQEEIRRQQAAEQARIEQERLADAYRHARYGDIIIVTAQGGSVAFYGKNHAYEPVAFELLRGETKEITFRREGRSHETTVIQMKLSEDGHTFFFDAPARKRIVIPDDGWARGRSYSDLPQINAREGHSGAVGVTLHISLKPLPGGPPKGFDKHHRR
jgi:hypothetical protein